MEPPSITGAIAAIGFIMLTNAYTLAPPSAVAPFEYTGVLWGIIVGWLVFGEAPSQWTWLGGVLIVGSGLYILHREGIRLPARRPRPFREPAAPVKDPPDIEPR